MKKSVKITLIVVCSLLIALAVVGGVFSVINVDKYEKIEKSHEGDNAWLDTDECAYVKLMLEIHNIQLFHTLGGAMCAVALLTAVLCWSRLGRERKFTQSVRVPIDDGDTPQFANGRLMSKTLLKVQIPLEIVCICISIACYFVLQYVTITNDLLVFFYALIMPQLFGLLICVVNIIALGWQYGNTKSTPLYKTKL